MKNIISYKSIEEVEAAVNDGVIVHYINDTFQIEICGGSYYCVSGIDSNRRYTKIGMIILESFYSYNTTVDDIFYNTYRGLKLHNTQLKHKLIEYEERLRNIEELINIK